MQNDPKTNCDLLKLDEISSVMTPKIDCDCEIKAR